MYERSALVLERYFSNLLGFSSENNIKMNYVLFSDLVSKLAKYTEEKNNEEKIAQEFEEVSRKIKEIQKKQENAYSKNAKLEYSRNMLFSNIESSPQNIEECLLKIENDIEIIRKEQDVLREEFVRLIHEYNEKKELLNKSEKSSRNVEKEYIDSLSKISESIVNINEFKIEFARNFNVDEVNEKLFNLMIDNGKDEKIPFNKETIENAVNLGMELEQKEVECYVEIYDDTLKLFDEIQEDNIKIEKFEKKLNGIKVKLNFILAEKDYLVQFLDYERITSVSGKKVHDELMKIACKNLNEDLVQIGNLYNLILKEIAGKATKKMYNDLYNKSYLQNIKKQDEDFQKEKSKVNLNVGTVLGSNYWRIEGIKAIYTVFYNDILDIFGKDLDEFDVPAEKPVVPVENSSNDITVNTLDKENTKDENNKESKKEEITDFELPQLISDEDVVMEAKPKRGRKKTIQNVIEEAKKSFANDEMLEKEKKSKKSTADSDLKIVEEKKKKSDEKVKEEKKKEKKIEEKSKDDKEVIIDEKFEKNPEEEIVEEPKENKKAKYLQGEPEIDVDKYVKIDTENEVKSDSEIKNKSYKSSRLKKAFSDYNAIQNDIKQDDKVAENFKNLFDGDNPDKIEEPDFEDVEFDDDIDDEEDTSLYDFENDGESEEYSDVDTIENETEEDEVIAEELDEDIEESDEYANDEESDDYENDEYEDEEDEDDDIISKVFDDDSFDLDDEDDDALFDNIKCARNTKKLNVDLRELERISLENKNSKKGLFKSLIKTNSKNNRKAEN